jgi:large subunit GTPase 1
MWNKTMTAEQVDRNEKLAFLEWRRGLAKTEEKYDVVMTPFEKNLEFWRQLWRVVEKSDVVVQVVDARNPLLYRCTSLEEYVRSVGAWKTNVILLNKADLLPLHLRKAWAREFAGLGIRCFFFAAKEEIEENHAAEIAAMREEEAKIEEGNEREDGEEEEEEEEEEDEVEAQESVEAGAAERNVSSGGGEDDAPEANSGEKQYKKEEGKEEEGKEEEEEGIDTKLLNSTNLLTTLEKIGKECVARASSQRFPTKETIIGFVGYPNVGKSSTINALVGRKRVGVSATAGKTKHFQTLFVSEELML